MFTLIVLFLCKTENTHWGKKFNLNALWSSNIINNAIFVLRDLQKNQNVLWLTWNGHKIKFVISAASKMPSSKDDTNLALRSLNTFWLFWKAPSWELRVVNNLTELQRVLIDFFAQKAFSIFEHNTYNTWYPQLKPITASQLQHMYLLQTQQHPMLLTLLVAQKCLLFIQRFVRDDLTLYENNPILRRKTEKGAGTLTLFTAEGERIFSIMFSGIP